MAIIKMALKGDRLATMSLLISLLHKKCVYIVEYIQQ